MRPNDKICDFSVSHIATTLGESVIFTAVGWVQQLIGRIRLGCEKWTAYNKV